MDTSAGAAEAPDLGSRLLVTRRPDLQVPLYPADSPLASFLRATLVGLRTPRFAEAQTANRRGFLALLALWAGQFAVVPGARPYIGWTAVTLMLWLLIRVYALGRAEKQQRSYEQRWLAVQTAALRDTWFEVVRCTVRRRHGPALDHWDEATYELARSGDVRRLLDRQASERGTGRSSRVTLEFTFPLPGVQFAALEAANADLTEIEMVVSGHRASCGGVRFPRASYHPESRPRGRFGGHWPSRDTFWVLGAPVLFVAAPDGGSAGEAEPSADGRPAR